MSDESDNLRPSRWCIKRIGFLFLYFWAWVSVVLFSWWATSAIYYHEFLPRWLGLIFAIAFVAGIAAVLVKLKKVIVARAIVAGMILLVYLTWIWITPRTDRVWLDQHQRFATISIQENRVSITGLRHTKYVTEQNYKTEYESFDFDLNRIRSVWFFVQRFTSLKSLGHTFLSFEIDTDSGRRFISVSAEIRCEPNEGYGPIRGMFKQYELIYIISDERDALGYRTHIRPKDRVWMYRCNATPEQAQQMFRDIAQRNHQLQIQPEFYHTLLNNCTNNIVTHANRLAEQPASYFDLKIILPGYSAKPAYKLGLIGEPGESFAELQKRSRVDEIARSIDLDENFSVNVRRVVPNSHDE